MEPEREWHDFDRRPGRRWKLVTSILIAIALLGVYVGYYVVASDGRDTLPGLTGRRFRSVAVARIYPPLTWLEAKLTRKQVHLWVNEPPYAADDYSYSANP